MMPNEHSMLLVDGMALLFRAYYASAYGGYIQKTSAGVPVNAVHGFIKYFWDAIETFRPTHVACCWDMGSATFRPAILLDARLRSVERSLPDFLQLSFPESLTKSNSLVNPLSHKLGFK